MIERNTYQSTPWGSWEIVYSSRDFTTKILTINPHCRLSLQLHENRDEAWSPLNVVDAQIDGKEMVLLPGENVIIPRFKVHRLMNNSDDVVQVVEVMVGKYDEDDIVRIDDDWNRK